VQNLVRRVVAVDQASRGLGNEVFTAAGATFVRSRALPIIHDANHVAAVRVASPAEIATLMARVETEFAHCRHRQFVLDPETPPEFEAHLMLDGYALDASLYLVLEGDLRATAGRHVVRRVGGEREWTAYARLKRLDWQERAERLGIGPLPEVGEGLIAAYRLRVPPTRYWLALVDDEPRGFISSWEGPEGVGQVEDLFVEKPFRHLGLATALIHHAVADCRATGAGPVAIVADTTDTPKAMYAAMGFRPVAVVRKYTRHGEE
jgi:GNAT superfamily N-acetyltransferase